MGRTAESDAALIELIEKAEHVAAIEIAYVLAYRGDVDRAFAWLDKAVQQNQPSLRGFTGTFLFENLHDDPRWLPFLERVGMSPAQLDAIEFKVTLPE